MPIFTLDYMSFVEIQEKYTGKHDLKMKNVEFSKFWDNNTNRKILNLWGYEAEAEAEPFPNHEAEALTS